jgi:hypothetical protein
MNIGLAPPPREEDRPSAATPAKSMGCMAVGPVTPVCTPVAAVHNVTALACGRRVRIAVRMGQAGAIPESREAGEPAQGLSAPFGALD